MLWTRKTRLSLGLFSGQKPKAMDELRTAIRPLTHQFLNMRELRRYRFVSINKTVKEGHGDRRFVADRRAKRILRAYDFHKFIVISGKQRSRMSRTGRRMSSVLPQAHLFASPGNPTPVRKVPRRRLPCANPAA
jgi:hypothetical protein